METQRENKEIDILSWNIGYLLGYDGSLRDYLVGSYRGILGDSGVERKILKGVAEVIEKENPDLACLMETDLGSYRTRTSGQLETLSSEIDSDQSYDFRSDRKYNPESFASNIPLLGKLGNGLMWKRKPIIRDINAHHLRSSFKDLVHEVVLNGGISILSVHAPLRKGSRKKYLEKLGKMIEKRHRVIVCGDFNFLEGMDEIESFARENNLQIYSPGSTFPAADPRQNIDLFFCSENVDVKDFRVVESSLSDHLPISLKVRPS